MTRENYRQIVSDFISLLSEQQQSDFEGVTSIEDFWPRWSSMINKHQIDGLYQRWLKWRTERIVEFFENRLKQLDVAPTTISEAVTNFKNAPKATAQPNRNPPIVRPRENTVSIQLKAVVHGVVDRMSDDDLRRIWLPLGHLIDLLKDNKR